MALKKKIDNGKSLTTWTFDLNVGDTGKKEKGIAMGIYRPYGDYMCYACSRPEEGTDRMENVLVVNTKELEAQGFKIIIK